MDSVCTNIMDLTNKNILVYYASKYSTYVKTRAENEVNQMKACRKQQEEISTSKTSTGFFPCPSLLLTVSLSLFGKEGGSPLRPYLVWYRVRALPFSVRTELAPHHRIPPARRSKHNALKRMTKSPIEYFQPPGAFLSETLREGHHGVARAA